MVEAADLDGLVAQALEGGAVGAKVIDTRSIVTAPWVRMKCRYGCGGYGSSLCCPPHTPTPAETQAVIDCYRRALLVHCKAGASAKSLVVVLERAAFLAGFYKAFAFGEGPCRLCEGCNLERCIHAQQARPSMEACGIDVFATARGNGFPIEVVTDRECDQNYYGLVLVE
jgi:predicted metal-binding protein